MTSEPLQYSDKQWCGPTRDDGQHFDTSQYNQPEGWSQALNIPGTVCCLLNLTYDISSLNGTPAPYQRKLKSRTMLHILHMYSYSGKAAMTVWSLFVFLLTL